MLAKLYGDFVGLRRVCGNRVALRWLGQVTTHIGKCAKQRNLSEADAAMGQGPFLVRLRQARARLAGVRVVSSIREICARNVYLGDRLDLPASGTVLDLGANRGYFTMLAAGGGPDVRVLALEPSRVGCAMIEELARLNGYDRRVRILNRFIGGDTPAQHDAMAIPDSQNVPYITPDELLDSEGIDHIALLKCDIEGSEFELLRQGGRLLAMTDQLAMEVHDVAGDRRWLIDRIRDDGFEVTVRSDAGESCIINARRRRAPPLGL